MTLCLPDAPWTWFQQHKLERKRRQRNVPNRKVLEREQMSDPEQVKADDARISSQVKKMKEEIIIPVQAPLCSSSASLGRGEDHQRGKARVASLGDVAAPGSPLSAGWEGRKGLFRALMWGRVLGASVPPAVRAASLMNF